MSEETYSAPFNSSDTLTDVMLACADVLWATPKEFDATPDDNEPTLIESIGQVRLMTLPPNWYMKKRDDRGGSRVFYEVWASPEDERTTFEFYYRGTPIKDTIAKALSLIMRSEPHTLNNREIQSLGVLVSYAFDKELFKLKGIHTDTLNGRRVLIIDGDFIQDGISRLQVFVAADEAGKAIQELIFQAPTADCQESIKVGKQAFNSIIWVWE